MPLTVPVGLLYSVDGPYSVIGRDCLDGALMAVDEVNDAGGPVRLEPHAMNPAGSIESYHRMSEAMLREHGCRHIVGTITSIGRKEVIPIIEKHDALLWYVCPYEGFECCENVIYAGASPNQHIVPLFRHVVPRFGRRAALVGSNYVWGWETNRIAREILNACGGEVLGERYLPMGATDVERMISEIEADPPDFILNNLIGPSSYAFFAAYEALARRDRRFGPDRVPIVSCNLTECELAAVGPAGIGHYSTAIYFESIDGAENAAFRARLRERIGPDRPVSAFVVMAYSAVRMLAEAVAEAGTDEIDIVRRILHARAFAAPPGALEVDPRTNHIAHRPHIGRIAGNGQFEVVESSPAPLAADPYLVDFDATALARAMGGGRPSLRVVQ